MEEISLDLLILDLAKGNPKDVVLQMSVEQIKNGYNRTMSPRLLSTLKNYQPANDVKVNGLSLFGNIISSLKIDSARAIPSARLFAQISRETLMKEYFLSHYKELPGKDSVKLFFRFGRNHLHRGFDSRGISTLGNFVSEFALAEGKKCFNVAAFAAGGQYALLGQTFDADERKDDIAFDFLSQQAMYDATIFDLRPLRVELHRIAAADRTDVQKRLLHWADSYDVIIFYRKVTPIK